MNNARMAAALTPPLAALMMLLVAAWPSQVLWAKSADSAALKQRYIIELRDPPLALSNAGRSEAESRLQQQAAAAGKGSPASRRATIVATVRPPPAESPAITTRVGSTPVERSQR